jgi:hypothetical protein
MEITTCSRAHLKIAVTQSCSRLSCVAFGKRARGLPSNDNLRRPQPHAYSYHASNRRRIQLNTSPASPLIPKRDTTHYVSPPHISNPQLRARTAPNRPPPHRALNTAATDLLHSRAQGRRRTRRPLRPPNRLALWRQARREAREGGLGERLLLRLLRLRCFRRCWLLVQAGHQVGLCRIHMAACNVATRLQRRC